MKFQDIHSSQSHLKSYFNIKTSIFLRKKAVNINLMDDKSSIEPAFLQLSELFDDGRYGKFLVPDYQRGFDWNQGHVDDLWEDIELTTEDKNMIVEIYCQKIPISQLEPNMLDNAFQDLQATDLSGDNFFLPNWLQSGYILKSYWDTYPDLGKIDLLVSEETLEEEDGLEEEPKFASKMNQGLLKSILLTKRDRISLMIVYPELDEN